MQSLEDIPWTEFGNKSFYASPTAREDHGHPIGFCRLLVCPKTRELLGAHVVGEQALEVAQTAATGMAANLTVDRLAETELAYPTITAILGLAARHLCRDLGIFCASPSGEGMNHPRATEWEHQGRPENAPPTAANGKAE